MKRVIFTCAVLITALSILAQTEFDALKFIQPDISGTARYSSMAGAFGALGGDPSAIKDNPAGLGIYRGSEITGSFGTLTQNVSSLWLGNNAADGLYKFGFNNLSYIISIPTSGSRTSNANLVRSNWAFSYNRLKDFNRNMKINGGSGSGTSITDFMAYFTGSIAGDDLFDTDSYNPYNNKSVPWLSILAANAGLITEDANSSYWNSLLDAGETVSPQYALREQGYLNEYALSWSGNFNNRLFLGATFNFYDLNYSSVSEYKEAFQNGGSMSLLNTFQSTGTGLGLKLGTIYAPLDYMRIGFSLQTPVIYTVSDVHYADLKYVYPNANGTIYSPEGDNKYKFQSPLVYNVSASFIIGTKGVVGIEYVTSNNSNSKFMDVDNSSFDYGYENDSINVLFNNQNTIKIGGEYKLTNNFAVRAGYALSGPATSSRLAKEFIPNTIRTDVEYFIHNSTDYMTAGLGYRENNWYIDVAVMKKTIYEKFYPYNTGKLNSAYAIAPATVNTSNLSIFATIGFRL